MLAFGRLLLLVVYGGGGSCRGCCCAALNAIVVAYEGGSQDGIGGGPALTDPLVSGIDGEDSTGGVVGGLILF